MDKEFLDNIINDMVNIKDDYELFLAENPTSSVLNIYRKHNELLKTLKFYQNQWSEQND